MDSLKGSLRKDTPAHVQMPNKLQHQMEKVSLNPTNEDVDDINQLQENKEIKSTVTTKRSRKPTPAHVQNQPSKNKTTSFDEDIIEQEEEDIEETETFTETSKTENKRVENTTRIYRKDTPAVVKTEHFKDCTWSSDSIKEEDDENAETEEDAENTLTCYRLRKPSILLCSHPSLEK
ncbi:uncharacterized protein LOC110248276 isoform X2 [Exaiptasia diaphana]|uniref:Uncharacterized protein n=1 Tax=Exaiptasia diaphana TaxID=2652724 RepID=A0A913XVD7_EXADI|nr:uncharacterized protein LOC110248276 isoform X2 [Exaiptasia diaphana]